MDTKKTGRSTLLDGLRSTFARECERRRCERGALALDVIIFALSLFFARRHIAFGAYPIATAFVATLPCRVWIALVGAVLGSLSLGRTGIIHAVIAVITVFLRIAISGGRGDGERGLFGEGYVMRCAAGTVGAFVGAAYGILLEGFSLSSVLFGVAGVLFTVLLTGVFYGIFFTGVDFSDFVFGTDKVFSGERNEDRWRNVLFEVSALTVSSLVSLSLEPYSFFGVSIAYVYTAAITLFIAKRFGAVRAMATGFFSAISVSASGGVAFALAGLGAGALFGIGAAYAVLGGGVLLSLWSAYDGGLGGFLSVFPEYVSSALVLFPILRSAPREVAVKPIIAKTHQGAASEDMVKLFAMSYRANKNEFSRISDTLSAAAGAIRRYSGTSSESDFLEYRRIVMHSLEGVTPYPCEENIEIIATKLYKKQKIGDADAKKLLGEGGEGRVDVILRRVRDYERERLLGGRMEALSREYELISAIIGESAMRSTRESALDAQMTKRAEEGLSALGLTDFSVAVLGERRRHIIAAGPALSGDGIGAPHVRAALEANLGLRLGEPSFYDNGDKVLFECSAIPRFRIESASAVHKRGEVISGDSVKFFESDDSFYSLVSDGMGSGEQASATSALVTDFLAATVTGDGVLPTAVGALNQLLRHGGRECSATVDLFSFDMLTGEALFVKSGATPSYIKRGSSLFRVRASTAPIGIMSTVDAEKIRVEVKEGDVIVMLTDGISPLVEDSAFLVELLSHTDESSPHTVAEKIVNAARAEGPVRDDLTVAVLRIVRADS